MENSESDTRIKSSFSCAADFSSSRLSLEKRATRRGAVKNQTISIIRTYHIICIRKAQDDSMVPWFEQDEMVVPWFHQRSIRTLRKAPDEIMVPWFQHRSIRSLPESSGRDYGSMISTRVMTVTWQLQFHDFSTDHSDHSLQTSTDVNRCGEVDACSIVWSSVERVPCGTWRDLR